MGERNAREVPEKEANAFPEKNFRVQIETNLADQLILIRRLPTCKLKLLAVQIYDDDGKFMELPCADSNREAHLRKSSAAEPNDRGGLNSYQF